METEATRPTVSGILETAVYVEDMARAAAFYERVFGFRCLLEDPRIRVYDVAGRSILLLFLRGASTQPIALPGGTIPPHDGTGAYHFAFAIPAAELEPWRRWLAAQEIPLTGEVHWERGGTSLYFSDPDGNALEILTPGVWATY